MDSERNSARIIGGDSSPQSADLVEGVRASGYGERERVGHLGDGVEPALNM